MSIFPTDDEIAQGKDDEIARLRAELGNMAKIHEAYHAEQDRLIERERNLRAENEAMRESLGDMIDEAEDCYVRDAHLIGTTERNTQVMATRRADIDNAKALLARQPVEKEIRQS